MYTNLQETSTNCVDHRRRYFYSLCIRENMKKKLYINIYIYIYYACASYVLHKRLASSRGFAFLFSVSTRLHKKEKIKGKTNRLHVFN